jgi:drug/metabolite transporter (DMT)-like permease
MVRVRSATSRHDAAGQTAAAQRASWGIGLVLLAMLLFTCMDTIGKSLTASYPVQQVVWGRYFFSFASMLVLIPRFGVVGLVRTRRPGLQIFRGLLLAAATLCMITAISVIPLADAYAITFTAPLLVTVLSLPLLGERVGWRRLAAVCVGLAGVLIVIRPGFRDIDPAMLLPLVTALCFALYQVLTSRVGAHLDETALAMLFYVALVGTAVMSALAPFVWQPVHAPDWGWMIATGALGTLGHLLLIRALWLAPASLLQPFIYSQIVWALAIGYLMFGDLPDLGMLLGGAVIIGSGLYVFYRQAVLGRS